MEGCVFILLMASFEGQKCFNLILSHLFIFMIAFAFGVRLKKSSPRSVSRSLLHRSFMVLGLTSKSLIHFELVFVYSVRQWSSFILLHMPVQFPPHYLLRGLWLPRWLSGKESAGHRRRHKRCGFDPQVRKIPQSRKWQPIPVFFPGKFHGQRSLVGHSQQGYKE